MKKDYSDKMVYMPGLKLERSDFKTNLAYYRNDKRITQAALAERSGVSLRTLQEYEQGRKPINGAAAQRENVGLQNQLNTIEATVIHAYHACVTR